MTKLPKTLAYSALGVLLLASGAQAATIKAAADMKDDAPVQLSGEVDTVNSETEFTLRDASGTIDVDLPQKQSVVLKKGQKVTVDGVVDRDVTGTDINATAVTPHTTLGAAVSNAIEANTNVSLAGATASTIKALPDQGLVKVHGTVDSVANEKEFTLKDATGSINIDVESNEYAALKKGSQVTVIGYVDNDVLGKDINASQVLITTDNQM